MKISSRNVNGIRAVLNKGFFDRVKQDQADIICLQEVKAFENQIPPEVRFFLADYQYLWHHGTRPGYAWTAIFYRKNLDIIEKKADFKLTHFQEDGRVTELRFFYQGKEVVVLNLYVPNGNDRADGTEMLGYKLEFYEHFRGYISSLRDEGKAIIACWDFNICHREIDIARPKDNEKNIGFLPIERAEMDKLEQAEFVDVFRSLYPEMREKYTWWSYRAGVRSRNIGWRLDYFWVSKDIIPLVVGMEHQELVEGSDHCPITLQLK